MKDDSQAQTVTRGELCVKAIVENLREVSNFVRDIGQHLRLSDEIMFDVDVAVEEASANIVRHAYPPGHPGDLLVRVETDDDSVRISLTDWGVPLDPKDVSAFDKKASIETRASGGSGLHLIYSLMDDVVRETASAAGQPNVLTLCKHIEHRLAL